MAVNVGDIFVKLGMDMSEFSKGLEDAQAELLSQSKKFAATGETLTKAFTLPLAGLATGAVVAFGGFEAELSKVSALGDIFGKDLEKLSNQAIELGKSTQYSAKEAAEAMATLAAGGFKAEEIFKAMPGVLSLAATEGMKIADASQITSDILHGFGLEVSEVTSLADLLAKTSAAGSTSVKDLGFAFSYVAGPAKQVGFTLQDTAAALGVLADAGIRGERGGTALRNIINDLVAPSKKAADAMDRLGINVLGVNGKLKPMKDIIAELQPLTNDTSAAVAIFGQKWSDVLPLLAKGGNAFAKTRLDIDDFGGSASTMSKIINDNLKGSLEQFTGGIETALISLGKTLAPTARMLLSFGSDIADALTTASEWFGKLPGPIKNFTIAFAALVALAGPALLFTGMLSGMLADLKLIPGMIEAAAGAFTRFGTAVISSNSEILLLSKGLREMTVGSIAKDTISFFGGIGNTIINAFKGIPGALAGASKSLIDFGATMGTAIVSRAQDLGTALVALGSNFLNFGKQIANGSAITSGFNAIQTSLTGLYTSITTIGIRGAWAGLLEAFGATAPVILGVTVSLGALVAIAATVAAAAVFIYKNWNELTDLFFAVGRDISNAFAAMGKIVLGWIDKTFGSGVASYIMTVWNSVSNFLKGFWNGVVDIFENGFKYILGWASSLSKALGMEETAKSLNNWTMKLDGMGNALAKAGDDARAFTEPIAALPPLLSKAATSADFLGKAGEDGFDKVTKGAKKAKTHLTDFEKDLLMVAKVAAQVKDALEDIPKTFDQFASAVESGNLRVDSSIKSIHERYNDLGRMVEKETDPKIQSALKGQQLQLKLAEDRLKSYQQTWSLNTIAEEAQKIASSFNDNFKMPELPDFANPIKKAQEEVSKLSDAYKELGLSFDEVAKTSNGQFTQLTFAAGKALEAYNLIKTSGTATAEQLDKAWTTYLERKVAAENEATQKILSSGQGMFKYLAASAIQSTSEIQLAVKKATDQFKSDLQAGLKDTFGKLFEGDFSGFLDGMKKLGSTFLGGVESILIAPAKALFDKFLNNMATAISDWVSKNIISMMGGAFDTVLGKGNALVKTFQAVFGGSGLSEMGEAATKAATTAANAAKTATAAGDAAATAAKTAAAAGEGAKAGAQAAASASQTVSSASKTASTAMTGAMSTVSSVVGIVGGVVSAVTGVLSYLQGRRMEQDIGRIEVTSRAIKNEVTNIRADEWERETHLMIKLDDVINTLRYFGDATTGYLSDLKGLLEGLRGDVKEIPKNSGQSSGSEQTKATQDNTDATEANTQAKADEALAADKASAAATAAAAANTKYTESTHTAEEQLDILSKTQDETSDSLKSFANDTESASIDVEDSFSDLSSSASKTSTALSVNTQGVIKSQVQLQTSASNLSSSLSNSAAQIYGTVSKLSTAFADTEDALRKQIDTWQNSGMSGTAVAQKIADLQSRIDALRGGTTTGSSSGNSGGVINSNAPSVYWGAPYTGISSTPITTLNVNVNNADAQKVANTIVSTTRARGVDW